jgi:lipoyl(octanoyl) transferase
MYVQHAPVYTMGKRGRTTDFRSNMELMLDSGIQIAKTSRGGETTYHGPGQVVMYPIIRLKQFHLGARAYVEALEDAMIDTGAEYGLDCKVRIAWRHPSNLY